MKMKLTQTFDSDGVEAALGLLSDPEISLAPAEQISSYTELMRHAYWQAKDLTAAIQIGQAGIETGMKLASEFPDQAAEIKGAVKAIHYDLASFTWPGWDEPGIEITREKIALGLASARKNLDLAFELKREALPLSRAYWMLGAQLLADGAYYKARENFSIAAHQAAKADSPADKFLAEGFLAIGLILDGQGDATEALETVKDSLRGQEHGDLFIKQLDDALRVFSG
jgi:tetratricopeptide (TPR) repeat protein